MAKFPSQNFHQMQYTKNKSQGVKIEELVNENKRNATDALRMDFFDDADRKARMNKVKRTVDEIMNQRNFMLNERRSRLVVKNALKFE